MGGGISDTRYAPRCIDRWISLHAQAAAGRLLPATRSLFQSCCWSVVGIGQSQVVVEEDSIVPRDEAMHVHISGGQHHGKKKLPWGGNGDFIPVEVKGPRPRVV